MTQPAAIILGASGSVGKALLAEVLRSGQFCQAIVVTRSSVQHSTGDLGELRAQGDKTIGGGSSTPVVEIIVPEMNPSSVRQAVVDALHDLPTDAVGFSVLGVGAGTAKLTLEQHRAVDVELNAAFAAGLKASGKVRHLAFMSAIGADINAKASGSGAAGMPRYARVKGEAEQAVQRQGPEVVSIFRPSVIVGSPHTPGMLASAMSLVSSLMPARYRPIRTTEIARAMVAAARSTPKCSAIYTYAEMMALIEAVA